MARAGMLARAAALAAAVTFMPHLLPRRHVATVFTSGFYSKTRCKPAIPARFVGTETIC